MKKLTMALALTVVAGVLTSSANILSSAGVSGKAIFNQYKCAKCHTIKSEGIKQDGAPVEGKEPHDLSGVGLKHDAQWLQKWLLKEEVIAGKKHIKKFSGSEDELKTLTGWLVTLKKK